MTETFETGETNESVETCESGETGETAAQLKKTYRLVNTVAAQLKNLNFENNIQFSFKPLLQTLQTLQTLQREEHIYVYSRKSIGLKVYADGARPVRCFYPLVRLAPFPGEMEQQPPPRVQYRGLSPAASRPVSI